MDKRDEIREGIADRLYSWLPCTDDEAVYCAAQLTKYLDSVDVVIKVDRELPVNTTREVIPGDMKRSQELRRVGDGYYR
ncbi:hypothetical protein LCGC14_2617500, partial [marine sediment metagenome]